MDEANDPTAAIARAVESIAAVVTRERGTDTLDVHDRAVLERSLGILRDGAPQLEQIVNARLAAGPDAVLYVDHTGDVVLYESAEAARGDDGTDATGRWQVNRETADLLSPLADR